MSDTGGERRVSRSFYLANAAAVQNRAAEEGSFEVIDDDTGNRIATISVPHVPACCDAAEEIERLRVELALASERSSVWERLAQDAVKRAVVAETERDEMRWQVALPRVTRLSALEAVARTARMVADEAMQTRECGDILSLSELCAALAGLKGG